ncbi:MAG: metal ABC transporter substrate-binding protein [Christensenellales bacterium]|jgi:ABC-type Zn uptake system ZnuABC Zn-binding protein ZnuA
MGKASVRFAALIVAALIVAALPGCAYHEGRDCAVMATAYPLYLALDRVAGTAGLSRGMLSLEDPATDAALSREDRSILGCTAILIASGRLEPCLENIRAEFPDTAILHADGEEPPRGCPWTDVAGHIGEVGRIAEALAAYDPGNAETYRANARFYIGELEELNALYERMMAGASGRAVVLFRESFAPMCMAYGLEVADIVTRSEEIHISDKRLAELVQVCRERQVSLLIVERGADPAAAEAVSAQAGVPLIELDPMLIAPDTVKTPDAGEYLRVMRGNLEIIAGALIWGRR